MSAEQNPLHVAAVFKADGTLIRCRSGPAEALGIVAADDAEVMRRSRGRS